VAIFAPLAVGRSALLAHQRALAVTGANVANVNTPGYSRQRVVLSPQSAATGGGVWVAGVEQIVDRLLAARELRALSSLGDATLRREFADRVQSLFPVDGPSIGTALDDFFGAASELSTHPEEIAVRSDVLARADVLASRVRAAAGGLAALQRELDGRIAEAAREVNPLLVRIARLNSSIAGARAAGAGVNELLDQRRQALSELSRRLDVRALERPDGTIDVFGASGAALVVADPAAVLAVEATAQPGLDGAVLQAIGVRDAGGGLIPLPGPLGGELGALHALRDDALPQDSASLDELATTLRDAVNAVQTDPAGRDLDGLAGAALLGGSGAADLAVVLGDPRGIAAARSATPGDNSNALALVALRTTPFASLQGARLADFHGGLLARVGGRARDAEDRVTVEENLAAALAAQRESVSGVNLEEEFTDLIRFQRGFEAASQLISVGNRMLDELMQMVRG
jgi:flagellar hook-associated protein 1 FlgK